IEGLLHLSQLSRGQVETATEVVQEGETHLLRVVSIDQERQRIGLSLRAVSATEQIEWMSHKQAQAAAEAEAAAEAAAEVEAVEDQTSVEEQAVEEPAAAVETEVVET